MKRSIVWLASYPKSGNTWLRIFLANYLLDAKAPLSINQVHKVGMGDTVARSYHMVAGRQIDLTDLGLVLRLRDRVLQGIVANNADINLVKTHHARVSPDRVPLIPDRYTRSAIYILRNPLDMVLSYARHYGIDPQEAVTLVTHPDNANAPTATSAAQYLGSWSDHVKSWMAYAPWPRLLLRYEDMLDTPEETFGKALAHLGVPVDPERLARAIRFSSFDEVSQQEARDGFIERPEQSAKFFGKGQKDQWKTDLDPALAERIVAEFGDTMKRYGYLE
ncbi:sulfotransferase domain-containing protein [Roseovarius autotrophicus]|uniref:sulfotransferase domain-containing protein n=1 Tax=Roseovarius autotrophicus TaxID=2824121 RepID=UPI0019F69D46|nr:sulfotransferase domain-containing protein [Roseovarius autotrophicus]MBE0452455.1 sulfotransferase domain-containing protein [Roseovarius sp.]